MHPTAAKRDESPPTSFGFKELASGMDPVIDIVALHGPNGHRETSWTASNGVLWLRDLLPTKIPNARILSYGYIATAHTQEQSISKYLHDYPVDFLSKLALLREATSTAERPILFVAHDFGGIMLKSALVCSYLSRGGRLDHHSSIVRSTSGVALFGTPDFHGIKERNRIHSSTVTELDSPVLQQQYLTISQDFDTKFFYEQGMGGGKSVPKASTVVSGQVNADAIAIDKDHESLVKFPSAHDDDFVTVATSLFLMCKTAPPKILRRWKNYKRMKEMAKINWWKFRADHAALLENLPRVKDAGHDCGDRPDCLLGTRTEVMSTIEKWRDDPTNYRVYWLNGLAGTGKTTIAQSFAQSTVTKGQLGASFFCSRNSADRREPRRIFPTIAFQLCQSLPEFRGGVLEAIEANPDIGHASLKEQLEKLVIAPCKNIAVGRQVIIIIDALDECEDKGATRTILSLLALYISSLPNFKFFLTSRPEFHIRAGFTLEPLVSLTDVFILHNVEASIVDNDIRIYLKARFAVIASSSVLDLTTPWPTDEEIDVLVKKCAGLFIFASIICNFVSTVYANPRKQVKLIMDVNSTNYEGEEGIDGLYLETLRLAFWGVKKTEYFSRLRLVLGSILLPVNPLPCKDLATLLGIDSAGIRLMLRHLHSVLIVPEDESRSIRIIHSSFYGFLTSNTRCTDPRFFVELSYYHSQLTLMAFNLMKQCLRKNLCEIPGYALNNDVKDLHEKREKYIGGALEYASRNWAEHLRHVSTESKDLVISAMRQFAATCLLYWIELLSIVGGLGSAVYSLKLAQEWLLNASLLPGDSLPPLLHDCERFILEFFDPICQSALQTYGTALLRTPKKSLLRSQYGAHIPEVADVLAGGETWGPCLRTVSENLGPVNSVEFSPDSRRIVAGFQSGMVRIWDAITGICLGTLEGHKRAVSSVAFSPGGDFIASGSNDQTVRVWDAGSGISLGVLDGHNQAVFSVSFSVSQIASGSDAVRTWDFTTGELSWIADTGSPTISLAFSPDGTCLATASINQTIRIWNAQNGTLDWEGRNAGSSVAYSLDGNSLAFGKPDTITIMNTVTRATVQYTQESTLATTNHPEPQGSILALHDKTRISIALSPDGSRVVFRSIDETQIRLVDANLDRARGILRGHSKMIKSLAFSPDGSRIVSCSDDGSIRIWDPSEVSPVSAPHSNSLHSTDTSPDGTRIISQHFEGPARLWDTTKGELMNHLGDPGDTTIFSPDSTCIVSYSQSGSIRLWSALTGTSIRPLTGGPVQACSFSPDSSRIVGYSSNETFRIWDVSTGELLAKQMGLKDSIELSNKPIFSPDSNRVLFGNRNDFLLWNARTGELVGTLESYAMLNDMPPTDSLLIFSRDSKLIKGSGESGCTRIWFAMTGGLLPESKQEELNCDAASRRNFDLTASGKHSSTSHQKAEKDLEDPIAPTWLANPILNLETSSQDLKYATPLTSTTDVILNLESVPRAGTDSRILNIEEVGDPSWKDKTPHSVFLLDEYFRYPINTVDLSLEFSRGVK